MEETDVMEKAVAPVISTRAPTQQTYDELQEAFDHFNETLFLPILGHLLPMCIITLQRERRTFGYYSDERFVNRGEGGVVDEIAMNPSYFSIRPIEHTLSTLAHEMCHQYQRHFGNPGRRGYHNREWSGMMGRLGLISSSTGQPGGRRVGERMSHYAAPDGPFEQSCAELLTRNFRLSWIDRYPPVSPDELPSNMFAGDDDVLPTPVLLSPGLPDDSDDIVEEGEDGYTLLPAEGDDIDDGGDDQNFQLVGPCPITPAPAMVMPKPHPIAPLTGIVLPTAANKSNRFKYRCSGCGSQVWGKRGLRILCGGDGCKNKPFDVIGGDEDHDIDIGMFTKTVSTPP